MCAFTLCTVSFMFYKRLVKHYFMLHFKTCYGILHSKPFFAASKESPCPERWSHKNVIDLTKYSSKDISKRICSIQYAQCLLYQWCFSASLSGSFLAFCLLVRMYVKCRNALLAMRSTILCEFYCIKKLKSVVSFREQIFYLGTHSF